MLPMSKINFEIFAIFPFVTLIWNYLNVYKTCTQLVLREEAFEFVRTRNFSKIHVLKFTRI